MSPFKFNNRFFNELPGEIEQDNFPRQVYGACYSPVKPTPVCQPQLVSFSKPLASQLGLSESDCRSDWFTQAFSGNQLLDEMQPFAMCYGGHQFGHWAGQLGDGRAINLGEVVDANGNNQTLQLKGAGLTPYSRTADGLAVLRSSLREYLCSEAMHYLNIPTTRALSLILTGEQVQRDMFYDGHPELEQGAVVCRVAPSFIRFGSFEIFASRQENAILKQLMDFTIRYHFSELLDESHIKQTKPLTPEIYEAWFEQVCLITAKLVVDWMRVGFVHGVMNTDNLSILGLTIDYGPYGWLEGYDPSWTPNTTDAQGRRYSYGNQPKIAQWNLYQLAKALSSIIGRSESLENSLNNFPELYTDLSMHMYADKLGLEFKQIDDDEAFFSRLFKLLVLTETDMTIFFRSLAQIKSNHEYSDDDLLKIIEPAYYLPDGLMGDKKHKTIAWLRDYIDKIEAAQIDEQDRVNQMNRVNPKYVLRNYLVQQAIDKAEKNDFSEIEKLLSIFQKPYDEQPEYEVYAAKRPEWARHKAGCSMLSCSS
jgi:uncharacterized protein YdiU (UPF0061 family)